VKVRPEWTVSETFDPAQDRPEVATVSTYAPWTPATGCRRRVDSAGSCLPPTGASSDDDDEVISVAPRPRRTRSQLVSKYGFNAIPVVNEDMRPLGIITVDDVIDVP
jgi:CBS domain-containing protein